MYGRGNGRRVIDGGRWWAWWHGGEEDEEVEAKHQKESCSVVVVLASHREETDRQSVSQSVSRAHTRDLDLTELESAGCSLSSFSLSLLSTLHLSVPFPRSAALVRQKTIDDQHLREEGG